MLTRRIIPCLDVDRGFTVKGVRFRDLQNVGDPVELGRRYVEEGADELVYLDITATVEQRSQWYSLVRRVAEALTIPFTVGGGVQTIADVGALLQAGADKVSVNTAAVCHPPLLDQLAREFGSQCIVLAMDVWEEAGKWWVTIQGGRKRTQLQALHWAREAVDRGAGEILLTSMNHDGTRQGFALELTRTIASSVSVPVIASGGAGKMEHFRDVFVQGKADAALAASVFHFRQISIPELKDYLHNQGIPVRKFPQNV